MLSGAAGSAWEAGKQYMNKKISSEMFWKVKKKEEVWWRSRG